MRYYETLYIVNPHLGDDEYKDTVTKFNNIVEKNKGVIIKVEEWGKKTLAYPIKKFRKGYYVLMQYCAGPDFHSGLKRDFKLDERILKYQTIKLSDAADPDALKRELEGDPVEEEPASDGDAQSGAESGEGDK